MPMQAALQNTTRTHNHYLSQVSVVGSLLKSKSSSSSSCSLHRRNSGSGRGVKHQTTGKGKTLSFPVGSRNCQE
eukprot:scaffold7779_cov107-Skeletonema_menzelii.AAC.1